MKRREVTAILVALGGVVAAACGGSSQAATPPTPTENLTPSPSPFQIQLQIKPQDARLGTDENVVIQARFMSVAGGAIRPVSGAQLSAVVNYPSGPKTITSPQTTFPDGRADLAIPVAPATRGANVRVDVIMTYQGQQYHQATGFNVR